jgi:hypothetical protein
MIFIIMKFSSLVVKLPRMRSGHWSWRSEEEDAEEDAEGQD